MAKLSVDQMLSRAKSHAKRGELDEAKKLYHSVLQAFPQNGRAKKGLDSLRQSHTKTVGQNPPQELLHKLLGHFQHRRFNDAEKLAVIITDEFPKHQLAWKVLGAILEATGRKSEALDANQTAAAISPQDAEAHYNLGNTLKTLGRLVEAEASYRRAVEIMPGYAKAHNNLGVVLKELGRLDEAKEGYNLAVALEPKNAKAHYNLGITLKELGRSEEAEVSFRQAILLKPDYAEALNNLGITLKELGRLEDAEAAYLRAIALKRGYAEAHNNLGVVLKELGRFDEAVASCKQAIALQPHVAQSHKNLGALFKDLGKFDKAAASYRQAIELKPDYAEAHMLLASIKTFKEQDEQYSKMLEIYHDKNICEEERCQINFGLAKACEDLGNLEQAFAHYKAGNEQRKMLLKYNINQDIKLFSQIKSNYSKIDQISLASDKLSEDIMPVFIVGMPRSGTTLVEQIISSHSEITGAGELAYVAQFGAEIAAGSSVVNENAVYAFRHKYLTKLKAVSYGNLIVTDKMPHNFLYLGLLAAAFPEAKIIHVKRNPAAVCWANYKQYFVSKNLGYCYALDDIVSYYGLYENLIEFWASKLSERIYDLDYERLTVDQESETRRLIDYIGLTWDEKCLSPQDNERGVATASNLQVREKVYQGSSQNWKRYQPFLEGAFDSLL